MTRLYDCFTFSNELDLLEIRLNELAPVVSVFVIAESPVTFQGDSKPLYFQDNQARFAAFADRIRHIVIRDMPEGDRERDHFRREHHQRNALSAALDDAAPDDFVLLSDVDEIPRARSVTAAIKTNGRIPSVHCFELAFYRFFLNYLYRETWSRSGPRMTRRRYLSSMQGLRDIHPPVQNPLRSISRWVSASLAMRRPIRLIVHPDSGWHFSYMGGVERVAQRMRSGSHVFGERARNPGATMLEAAQRRIDNSHTDKDFTIVPLDARFPNYLLENRNRFRHMMAPMIKGSEDD